MRVIVTCIDLGSTLCFITLRPRFSFHGLKDLVDNVKGKEVPLETWSGPEDSRKLSLPDFLKTAQDGGKVANPTHRPHLPSGNTPGTHFC
jgi:hypothetical protein